MIAQELSIAKKIIANYLKRLVTQKSLYEWVPHELRVKIVIVGIVTKTTHL